MKLSRVAEILEAKVLSGEENLDSEVTSAFGCDLMSDVLAFVNDKTLLLTGLINLQVIRTAEMMDIGAIVFVRGKEPDESIVELAKNKEVVVMTTEYNLYTAAGELYVNGLPGKKRG